MAGRDHAGPTFGKPFPPVNLGSIRAISCTCWVSVCPFCCPFAHLSFGLCAFFSLVCRNSLYILDTSLFLDVCFANVFSYPMVCLVTFSFF